jgi:hypothetical protein
VAGPIKKAFHILMFAGDVSVGDEVKISEMPAPWFAGPQNGIVESRCASGRPRRRRGQAEVGEFDVRWKVKLTRPTEIKKTQINLAGEFS